MKPVVIIGGGGHASVVLDVLRLRGRDVAGFVAPDGNLGGLCRLGDDAWLDSQDARAFELAMGIGMVRPGPFRPALFDRLKGRGFAFATLAHPSAVVAASATLGEGAQIMAGAVVQPGAAIGANAIVNSRAVIDHDCRIGDHVHVATGAALSGGVEVGEGALVGTGAAIIQGIRIGAQALVAAGATVVRDVADGQHVAGVPARPMRK